MGKYNFKVGDKLKVVHGCNHFVNGDIVTCNKEINSDYDMCIDIILSNGVHRNGWSASRFELIEDKQNSPQGKFKVGDRVKILDNAIGQNSQNCHGKVGIIEKLIKEDVAEVRFSGGESCRIFFAISDVNDRIEIELVSSKEETPSKNVNMTIKKIYNVLIVDKKTGKATKDEKVVAGDEQQAILKTFGVDAENTFIKITELGEYKEEKPVQAVLVKQEVKPKEKPAK